MLHSNLQILGKKTKNVLENGWWIWTQDWQFLSSRYWSSKYLHTYDFRKDVPVHKRMIMIIRDKGFFALYRGILPGSIRSFLANGTSMVVMSYAQRKVSQLGLRKWAGFWVCDGCGKLYRCMQNLSYTLYFCLPLLFTTRQIFHGQPWLFPMRQNSVG